MINTTAAWQLNMGADLLVMSNILCGITCPNDEKEGGESCDKEEEKVWDRLEENMKVASWVRKQSKDMTFLFNWKKL